jgi:hypothetical protein
VNKYLPGGRCGGEAGRSETNPEFDSSLNRLLQQREQLDMAMKPVTSEEPKSQPPPKKNIQGLPASLPMPRPTPRELGLVAVAPVKRNKDADIELLLQGDYMDE